MRLGALAIAAAGMRRAPAPMPTTSATLLSVAESQCVTRATPGHGWFHPTRLQHVLFRPKTHGLVQKIAVNQLQRE